ncbi:MAG: HEAT repeat domain-containing protein [Phycisphaerae bacterium]|jgi:hypothetical protein|nr:HEAT repeat domain-containing protein [Phycisphaerae bacterium]
MKPRAVFVVSICLCCGLIAYQSLARFALFDRNAELIRLASRPRPDRRAGVAKPMTLAMVIESLESDCNAKRLRGVLGAKRFVTEHRELIPLLIRVYTGRNVGYRTAAAAGMVLGAADGPFSSESVDELVKVMQDRRKCCLPENERKSDPEEQELRAKHPVRYQALEMLCTMNSDVAGVVPAIIEADYADCLNRDRWRYLEWIGPGQRGDLAALSRLMSSGEARVRYDAAICLGYHSDSSGSVIPLLVRAMENEEASGMRRAMLMSFARIAGRDQSTARVVARALRDRNCVVRADAAKLLGDFKMDREAHAAMLLEALDDFWPPVRQHAAESLGKIAIDTPEIKKRLITALWDEEYTVRLAVAETLIRLGYRQWKAPVVRLVIAHLGYSDPAVRRAAAGTVGRIAPDAQPVVDTLVRVLAGEIRREVANDLCLALESIGPDAYRAAEALVRVMETGDARLTRSAVEALRSIGSAGDGAVARLICIMKDSEREISTRVAAAGALLHLAPEESAILAEALELLRGQAKFRPAMDHWPIELLASHEPMSDRTVSVLRQFVIAYRTSPWASSVSGSDRAVMLAAEGMGRSADPKASGAGTAILIWMMKTGRADFDPVAMEAAGAAFWRNDRRVARSMRRANLGRYDYRRRAIEALGRLGPTAAGAAEHLGEMARWKDLRLVAPARSVLKRIASKS